MRLEVNKGHALGEMLEQSLRSTKQSQPIWVVTRLSRLCSGLDCHSQSSISVSLSTTCGKTYWAPMIHERIGLWRWLEVHSAVCSTFRIAQDPCCAVQLSMKVIKVDDPSASTSLPRATSFSLPHRLHVESVAKSTYLFLFTHVLVFN